MKTKNYITAVIISIAIAIMLCFIGFARNTNRSVANVALDVLATQKADGVRLIAKDSFEKESDNGSAVATYQLYELKNRQGKHCKYIVVISDNNRSEKSAFVVSYSQLDKENLKNGRISRDFTLVHPTVCK